MMWTVGSGQGDGTMRRAVMNFRGEFVIMQRKKEEEKKEEKREEKNRTGSVDTVDLKLDLPVKKTGVFFENRSEWLTTLEAAIFLRKFLPDGNPSANAVYKMLASGTIRGRKLGRRLFFSKVELDYLIKSSVV